ncbi:MAG: 50S ribosomal protein L10 [Bacteroidetes bacterium]|nr:MAG: 50S ribosomal protein L10 [Bacteroidota bacterium]
MKKEEKNQVIDSMAERLKEAEIFYLADISELNVETSGKLRRLCFKRNVQMQMIKNTLLKKAMEKSGKEFEPFFSVLSGSTSILFADVPNEPAKLIKEFRRTSTKPILKGAWVEETVYLGDEQLDALVNIKSKNELVADVIALLLSPARNVISALQSGGTTLSGLVKTLSEKPG